MTNVILGAHLCGLSTRRLDRSFGKVNTIVGLDPAGPGFSYDDIENRLDRTDADYVLVLHTDTRMYGMREAIGHGLCDCIRFRAKSSLKIGNIFHF